MGHQLRRLAELMLGLLCVIAPLQQAFALDPNKAISQYVHSAWQSEEGLPENAVMNVLRTSDGYLWVGTQNGLARFDGIRFTVFNHVNTPALHNDYIVALAEDDHHDLWVATESSGLVRVHQGHFSNLTSKEGLPSNRIWRLANANDGGLWAGGTGGFSRIDGGKVTKTYTKLQGLNFDQVTALLPAADGTLWIATPTGVNKLTRGQFRHYANLDGLAENSVRQMLIAHDGTLWVCTTSGRIARLVGDRFQSWTVKNLPAGISVKSLLEDRNGNLWIATAGAGLFRFAKGRVTAFAASEGLHSNSVHTLHEDGDGNLWVGTLGGGLHRFRDGSFTTYSKDEGLKADVVYPVIQDNVGDMWIGTESGLNRLHDGAIESFGRAQGLSSDLVMALWVDHLGDLWVGTSGAGLDRVHQGHAKSMLTMRNGLPSDSITSIFEDRRHQLWIGTNGGGLARYAKKKVDVFLTSHGLSNSFVFAIAEARDGDLWVGTDDGLKSIRDGVVKTYGPKNGYTGGRTIALYADGHGFLWIGTQGHGLFRLGNGRFVQYAAKQGLPDDTINGILEDARNNLWMSSTRGVFRISRSDLDAVAAGAEKVVKPLTFDRADGMKSSEGDGALQPAAWRSRDGRLWFGTARGAVVVDPEHLIQNQRIPKVDIESMSVDDKDVGLDKSIRLAPGTRRLDIRYTAPDLSQPERIQFRYRLDGFDESWEYAGTQREAHYTNLPPGHYRFRVSASSETGMWSARESVLDFDLTPQFYQAWWFRLLVGCATILVLLGFYRLRIGWLHARAAVMEERHRIAREIHDSLAQGLSGIIFQTEAAIISMEHAPNMTSTHLTSARELAKSSLEDARSSVWNLSPHPLDQKILLELLTAMAQQLAGGRVDELQMHSSGTAWLIPPEAQHHIVLMAQEAISNALQHGKARKISIDLDFSANDLHLLVSDNGIGFAPNAGLQQPSRGYGMRNMRHRSKCLGAKFDVTSEVGSGTRVSVRVPRPGKLARLWGRLHVNSTARIDG